MSWVILSLFGSEMGVVTGTTEIGVPTKTLSCALCLLVLIALFSPSHTGP